jgi:hypothetical protein
MSGADGGKGVSLGGLFYIADVFLLSISLIKD